MRNNKRFIAAVLMAALVLGGCKTEPEKEVASIEENTNAGSMEEADKDGNAFIEQLRTKYAANETANYKEPMHLLPENHKFVYENVAEEVFFMDVYSAIEVYSDAELTNYVDVKIEEDYDKHTITVEPNQVFNLNAMDSSYDSDGTWGSRSKFYLVERCNLETGEAYEKPQITVFTIKKELEAPTVKQSVSEEGYYQLSWNAVEGAEEYEVYRYSPVSETALLELTTKKTTCVSEEFDPDYGYEEDELYQEDDETIEIENWSINTGLELDADYFVVAKKNGKVCSGMSNLCDIEKIAGSIPIREDSDEEVAYKGNSALDLPTHTIVEMLDETRVQMLIEYENIEIVPFGDTLFQLNVGVKNLPIAIQPRYYDGLDEEAFMADMEKVIAREKKLFTKSVTQETDINISYVPQQDNENATTTVPEGGETQTEEKPEIEAETQKGTETEAVTEEEATEQVSSSGEWDELIHANSALAEWLAIQMMNHEEVISLNGFPEASDTEYLCEVFMEVYKQNPLIDVMTNLFYDYNSNTLLVSYAHEKEEYKEKQTASIEKAKEIAASIITEDMSDFEKEDVINDYLCKNGSYNETIYEYIGADGTISDDALKENVNSFLPYGILVENVGVCESYSEAFWLIAKMAGLDVVIETGKLDGVNHEWNRVKIDDSWCVLDVTNNDNEYIPNCYFNLSDEMSAEILIPDYVSIASANHSNYQATDEEKEYYYQTGKYAVDEAEAISLLSDSLADGGNAAVRMANQVTESEIQSIIGEVGLSTGLTDGMYYYYEGVLSIVTE